MALVVFSGGFDRVHYALVLAAAAAATGRPATLLFTGRALRALIEEDLPGVTGWHDLDPADDGSRPVDRDRYFSHRGVATFEELLESCVALGVRFIACEMGLRTLGSPADPRLRSDLPIAVAGVVTFLAAAPPGATTLFL
jgi:peroxiredoxin family protein